MPLRRFISNVNETAQVESHQAGRRSEIWNYWRRTIQTCLWWLERSIISQRLLGTKEKSSLDHIRSGFTKTPIVEAQEIIINVECECGIHFKISTSSTTASDHTDYIPNALLASSGLHLQSQQKEKAAFLFEQPETVQSLIDLFSTSGASQLEVSGNKVTALIKEPGDTNRSPAEVSAILELLDRFARLLEFIAEEHHAAEN